MLQSNSDKFTFLTQKGYLSCLPDSHSTILDCTFHHDDKLARINNNKRFLGSVMRIINDHYNGNNLIRQVKIRNYPDKNTMMFIKKNIKKYGIILKDIHKDRTNNVLNVTIKYTNSDKFYQFRRKSNEIINDMIEKIDD